MREQKCIIYISCGGEAPITLLTGSPLFNLTNENLHIYLQKHISKQILVLLSPPIKRTSICLLSVFVDIYEDFHLLG